MSVEREERLREMGMSPVWRLRAAAAAVNPTPMPMPTVVPVASTPTPMSVSADGTGTEDRMRAREIILLERDPLVAHIAGCQACTLCRTRKNTVPGAGNPDAGWMLVGEAPGGEEDAQGEPFVGQAGRLLDNMLKAIGLDRAKDVFITNVLKCRPPNNRNPEPAEIAQCAPYLERQVALVQPGIILALGRFAAMTLLDTDASIAALRGRVHRYQGVPLIVTYHPAYLLRNLPEKAKAWEDLVFARRTLANLQIPESTQS